MRGVTVIQTERKPGESLSEYHKRLIYGKLVDKTLDNVSYTELAELVYGVPYSADVARRMFYGARKTYEELDKESLESVDDPDMIQVIREETETLRKEQRKFYDQRREYNKLLAADGRREHLYDELAAAATRLTDTIGSVFDGAWSWPGTYGDSEAVLVLSDWHYGMTADNVFNKYSTDICKKRLLDIVSAAKHRILLHSCRKLHIVVLGDLIHGAIHTSARVASEELVCEQIMQASELLAQTVLELNRCVQETDVYITYGNHARTVQNKSDNLHRDNMERLIPWWLKERILAEESRLGQKLNIEVMPEPDTEFLYLDVCGYGVCASHGDLDALRSSPRLLTTLFQKQYGKELSYILLGDKHHSESFDEIGVTALLCGSLCGTDDYANEKRLFSAPSQLLLIMNKEDGIDAEYRLHCR